MAKVPTKEKDVKKQVKDILNKHDWFWWMPQNMGMGVSGVSDLCALKNGVFMAIETKFGKNEVTPLQRGFLESVKANQSFAFIVNESNVEWLKVFVEAFDRATIAQIKKRTPETEDGAAMLNAIRALSV